MSFYPTLDNILSGPDRDDLLRVRRSLRSVISSMVLLCGVSVVVYILNYFFYDWAPPQDIPIVSLFSVRWLAIVPVILLLEIIRKYHDDLYIIGADKLTHFNGRLSLKYQVPVVKYSDVRTITVYQDIWGRMFNYGDVELGTAAQQGYELCLTGVRAPEEIAAIVDQLRITSQAEMRSPQMGRESALGASED